MEADEVDLLKEEVEEAEAGDQCYYPLGKSLVNLDYHSGAPGRQQQVRVSLSRVFCVSAFCVCPNRSP